MKHSSYLFRGVAVAAIAANLSLSPTQAEPVLDPATGQRYDAISILDYIPDGITWDEAALMAEAMGGYLAAITSAEENEFLLTEFPQAFEFGSFGYWIGGVQPGDTDEPDRNPDAGWEWITGELFVYSNWALGEPNDCSCEGDREDAIQLWPGGYWNDIWRGVPVAGFIIEYDRDPNPGRRGLGGPPVRETKNCRLLAALQYARRIYQLLQDPVLRALPIEVKNELIELARQDHQADLDQCRQTDANPEHPKKVKK